VQYKTLCVARLPYVEATTLEVMRYKPLAPVTATHRTLRDTEVGGYFIPAKSTVSRCTYTVIDNTALSQLDISDLV